MKADGNKAGYEHKWKPVRFRHRNRSNKLPSVTSSGIGVVKVPTLTYQRLPLLRQAGKRVN